VLEKRMVLREEVHVTKKRRQVRNPQRVTLRREEVLVERSGDQQDE
jgi:stress response protein YsnF